MTGTRAIIGIALLAALGACAQGPIEITASGTHVTIAPSGPIKVPAGATQAFTVTPESGYTMVSAVTGSCPAGAWSGNEYTTGKITASCSVGFSATAEPTFTVTASGSHVTFSPTGTQTVVSGTAASFTVTADTDYTRPSRSGGTCPAGTWNNGVYTTGAITADCTVTFGAASDVTVTAGSDVHLRISPAGTQSIIPGTTLTYTMTATSGWAATSTPGGTCPVGGWSNGVYTTGSITTSCTVAFTSMASILQPTTWTGATVTNVAGPTDTAQVSFDDTNFLYGSQTAIGTAAASEIIRFHWELDVSSGETKWAAIEAFADGPEGQAVVALVPNSADPIENHYSGTTTLTLSAGYTFGFNVHEELEPFAGTLTVTTLNAVSDFHVTASADSAETVAPAGAVVAAGSTPVFTVIPNAGDMVASVGGTCAAGTWSGADYLPGAVTADCTVSFSGGAGTGGLDTGIVPDAGVGTTVDILANQITVSNDNGECLGNHDQTACLAGCVNGAPQDCPDGGVGDAVVPHLQMYVTDGPGPDIKLDTDPPFYTALNWAAELWPNLPAGSSQSLSASLSVTSTAETLAFESPPALDALGNLTFATTPGTYGQATVLATTAGAPSTTFTITVNTPPQAQDISVNFPWKSPCIPITIIAQEVDFWDWLDGVVTSLPSDGILVDANTTFATPSPGTGPYIPGAGQTGGEEMFGPEAVPGEYEHTMCYVPLIQTWTGFDTFTYEVKDDHGGSSSATVDIFIFQD